MRHVAGFVKKETKTISTCINRYCRWHYSYNSNMFNDYQQQPAMVQITTNYIQGYCSNQSKQWILGQQQQSDTLAGVNEGVWLGLSLSQVGAQAQRQHLKISDKLENVEYHQLHCHSMLAIAIHEHTLTINSIYAVYMPYMYMYMIGQMLPQKGFYLHNSMTKVKWGNSNINFDHSGLLPPTNRQYP